ncbi:MAG: anhydro-N-acetylmuramic acid kinase [Gammaproteobacteria bacterium]|nr:anhydro-N-acetylmuramic acid kinase [Gammaproteobacteria bacterium]
MPLKSKCLFIGLMSGTSMDGIDAAVVLFENNKTNLIATHSITIPAETKSNLTLLLKSENINVKLLGETDTQLGELFSQAVLELLKKVDIKAEKITAIGSHGQTIYHSPNGIHPFTLQIGDPNIIAARTKITTFADFRRKDIALGGQGAPLVPAFHAYLLRDQGAGIRDQFVLNLGGIANITYLPADKSQAVIGYDTGPANTLLDQWCEKHTGKAYDKNGDWARSGKLIPALLQDLLNDPYFQKPFPKSTGREYFNLNWLQTHVRSTHVACEVSAFPADIQNTLTELTAKTISDTIKKISPKQNILWLCGGGTYNQFLIERLKINSPQLVIKSTTEIGIDPQWIEAAAFAWLAKQTIEHKPGNCPSVTGARSSSILGGVYYQ